MCFFFFSVCMHTPHTDLYHLHIWFSRLNWSRCWQKRSIKTKHYHSRVQFPTHCSSVMLFWATTGRNLLLLLCRLLICMLTGLFLDAFQQCSNKPAVFFAAGRSCLLFSECNCDSLFHDNDERQISKYEKPLKWCKDILSIFPSLCLFFQFFCSCVNLKGFLGSLLVAKKLLSAWTCRMTKQTLQQCNRHNTNKQKWLFVSNGVLRSAGVYPSTHTHRVEEDNTSWTGCQSILGHTHREAISNRSMFLDCGRRIE